MALILVVFLTLLIVSFTMLAFATRPSKLQKRLSQRIQQISEGVLNVNQGSLYPALYRLEEQGWITSEWGSSENNRQAKYYKLTRAGRKRLVQETENWERLSTAINQILKTA